MYLPTNLPTYLPFRNFSPGPSSAPVTGEARSTPWTACLNFSPRLLIPVRGSSAAPIPLLLSPLFGSQLKLTAYSINAGHRHPDRFLLHDDHTHTRAAAPLDRDTLPLPFPSLLMYRCSLYGVFPSPTLSCEVCAVSGIASNKTIYSTLLFHGFEAGVIDNSEPVSSCSFEFVSRL